MKWLRTLIVFDQGAVAKEADWKVMHESYVRGIESIAHPAGSGKLILREARRVSPKLRLCNGVGYLRSQFLSHMKEKEKWLPEADVNLHPDRVEIDLSLYPSGAIHRERFTSKFGGFDFLIVTENKLHIALEWETGNISSSHRSMNKLAIALASGAIQAGVLIVPSRACYQHLTDRIGNIGELSGYLEVWEAAKVRVKRGLLAITVVEQDELTNSDTIPYLPLGADGRSNKSQGRSA